MSSGRGVAARPATSLKGPCRVSASESCDHRQRAAAHRPSRGWTRVGGPEHRSRLPDAGGPDRRRHAHNLPRRAPWRCHDEEAERGERAAHRPRPASGEWSPLRPDGGGGRLYDRPGHRSGQPGEHADGALQRREPVGSGLQSQDGPPEADRTLAYAREDPHFGRQPLIAGTAYTNNVAGAETTEIDRKRVV